DLVGQQQELQQSGTRGRADRFVQPDVGRAVGAMRRRRRNVQTVCATDSSSRENDTMPLPAIKPAPTLVALALLVALGGTPANADAPAKIWVATAGADGPACGTEAAPCRTFGFAVAMVADGGEVGVLTAGDYGILRIDGSVSIVNDGA